MIRALAIHFTKCTSETPIYCWHSNGYFFVATCVVGKFFDSFHETKQQKEIHGLKQRGKNAEVKCLESFFPIVCARWTVIFEWASNKNKTITQNKGGLHGAFVMHAVYFPQDRIQIVQCEAWKQITNPCSLNVLFFFSLINSLRFEFFFWFIAFFFRLLFSPISFHSFFSPFSLPNLRLHVYISYFFWSIIEQSLLHAIRLQCARRRSLRKTMANRNRNTSIHFHA